MKKRSNQGGNLLGRLLRKKRHAVLVPDETSSIIVNTSSDVSGRFLRGLREGRQDISILSEETKAMDRKRRIQEQDGHRQLAKVHAREHALEETATPQAPEGEMQNSIRQHPWLDRQRFDGIDPNLNPEPPLNTDARREFDNERREQEMEKQLRLGNMPKFGTAPRPEPR